VKKDIHPEYHAVKVTLTSGEQIDMKSTWGAEGDNLNLEIDPSSHPAWTGGHQKLVDTGGRVSKFNQKYGDMGF
jgi:large subunit ribosomal protein L31